MKANIAEYIEKGSKVVVEKKEEEKAEYILHSFTMGDVEDPDLYVAAPIYEWQQTTAGKTAMKYAKDPKYYIRPDDYSMGYKVTVTGTLEGKYATFYELKKS